MTKMDTSNIYESLEHSGVKRRSGRYQYGSGDNPYQHEPWFKGFGVESAYKLRDEMDSLKEQGMTQKQIADYYHMSTTKLRRKITDISAQIQDAEINQVNAMHEDGKSVKEISERMDISDSKVRKILKGEIKNRQDTNKEKQMKNIETALEKEVEKYGYVDVGLGTEISMGVSKERLDAVLKRMQENGYYVHNIEQQRLSDKNKYTRIKTLTKNPDVMDTWKHASEIKAPGVQTDDNGLTILGIKPPKQLDWSRVGIRYGDEGGTQKDGTIELRRGVPGLDLGGSNYAQVRIAVGGTNYLKGMAHYSDHMPNGVDVMFNTNKSHTTPKEEVLKPLKFEQEIIWKKDENGNYIYKDGHRVIESKKDKVDKDGNKVLAPNPFGASIKNGPDGQRGYLNIVNEEGDWSKWSTGMPSQFLAKQTVKYARERLNDTVKAVQDEHSEIMKVDNPIVKKALLEQFSNECKGKAQDLKAKGTARSMAEVLLPLPSIKPNEIYAPNFKDGENVVLVRYPHAGRFELAQLTVNNKVKEGKEVLGAHPIDGVGIHPSVAQKLSGADFDGDTVYVFPNNNGQIKVRESLPGLKDFDPNIWHVDHDTISPKTKQIQMGIVSNLITDMTIKGASDTELTRAVKQSMVVIDSEKHKLDYKASAEKYNIADLINKYQNNGINPETGRTRHGASTIISRASSEEKIPVLNRNGTIKTKNGKPVMENSTKMSEVDDARKLVSKEAYPIELVYADYANKMKSMQNESAKEALSIAKPTWNRDLAKNVYAKEVASLNEKYKEALANKPKERQAQLLASQAYNKLKYTVETKDERKRLRSQVEEAARKKTGSKARDTQIVFSDKEWEAVQAGAISASRLESLLKFADMDRVRELATPRANSTLSPAKIRSIKSMLANGYTQSDVADRLGISTSTIWRALNGGEK